MDLLQTTAIAGADGCRHCMQVLENIVSFFGGKIQAIGGKIYALDVRAYRTRLKELEAREPRKEESDSCVEEGVSCDCANEETSAAAPGGCVAPRRNEKGRGAVCPKATFHSPPSHAPDCFGLCESCECPSRSDGPPVGRSCSERIARQGVPSLRDGTM